MSNRSIPAGPPGRRALLVLMLALVPGVLGALRVERARAQRVRARLVLDGVRLELGRAWWLHEERSSHGASVAASPGAPAADEHRLSVLLTASAAGGTGAPPSFDARELQVRLPSGEGRRPLPAGLPPPTPLGPGQRLTFVAHIDVPSDTPVRLEWQRAGAREALLASRAPPRPGGEGDTLAVWPARVEELPPGDAQVGRALFHGRLACASCHGTPEGAGASAGLGPPLHDLARRAAARALGQDARQYVYESLLDPDAFVPAACGGGQPCALPSAMPRYGEVLSAQEMAHLVRYLVAGPPAPPGRP